MKWTLQLVLFIALAGNAAGQDIHKGSEAFCENLADIALDEVNKVFIAPSQWHGNLKSAKSSSSTFKVTFHNFPEEAIQAFNYAVSIWEGLVSSPVPIHIEARWETLEGNILAKGNPAIFYNNFAGAPIRNVYYPVALAEKLSGRDMNNGAPDIIVRFSNKYKWYFGTDGNTPSTHYDFVSSTLHEITHGLGFSGFLNEREGKGFYNNSNELPSIYDYLLFNHYDQQISDKSLFKSNSTELFEQITSDNVKFCQAVSASQDQRMIDWIFAPPVWNDGTSIYHLKGYSYGQENSLMAPFAVKGQAIHDPGSITLSILAELGWKNVSFDFNPLKDLEKTVAEWPFQVKVNSEDEEFSNVKVVYSFDGFASAKNISLHKNDPLNTFTGNMLLENRAGEIQYFIEATTLDNRTYRHPSGAPSKYFSMTIGPDEFKPNLFHNPIDMIAGNNNKVKVIAEASDNTGIKSIKVDYKINGQLQEPVYLTGHENDLYYGSIDLAALNNINSRFEYKITAEDISSNGNKKTFPATGFQEVKVVNPYAPVTSYTSDFRSNTDDFFSSHFSVSPISGFSGYALHTRPPYPVSAMEKEKHNIVAQLKYPVIIQEDGHLTFDEIVLVEPGEQPDAEGIPVLWDYVIVEASNNNGRTWLPLTEKYNSGMNTNWYTAFTKSFSNNESTAKPQQSMFVNRTIQLTKNTGLEAGDTAIFRFRLASDNSVTGFGWVIDNIKIQEFQDNNENLYAEGSFLLYPNPAKDFLFVEWKEPTAGGRVEIVVTDMFGRVVHRKNDVEPDFSDKAKIDLSNVNPGMYMVSISNGSKVVSADKIFKN